MPRSDRRSERRPSRGTGGFGQIEVLRATRRNAYLRPWTRPWCGHLSGLPHISLRRRVPDWSESGRRGPHL